MSVELKVLTLNCWGIPWVSSDRGARMRAIAAYLATQSDCDVACLQEVWSESDYDLLKNATAARLPHTHYFHSGVVGSGVCVLSRHQLLETFFHQWPINGYMHKVQHGDWWGGKGVALCRMLVAGRDVYVYTTHLHAEYDRRCDEYAAHRVLQAYDTAQFVKLTGRAADVVILAGDLNSEPQDLAYRLLLSTAGLQDAYTESTGCWTNEAPGNSYASGRPKRIDYVLYGGSCVLSCKHEMPLALRVPDTGHSYSDHEAVLATVILDKPLRGEGSIAAAGEDMTAQALTDSLQVLEQAERTLITHKRMYGCACLVLFAALWVAATGTPGDSGLLAWIPAMPLAALNIARIVVTSVMLFALVMATLWNRIEYNAVRATSHSMQLQLKQLAH